MPTETDFTPIKPGKHAVEIPPTPGSSQRIYVERVKLTKELATTFLKAMPKNRPVKLGKVTRYVKEMDAGQWPFTCQPIIISNQGFMIDGQNRCLARQASESIEDPFILVVYGVDESVFPYLDAGAPRTSGDTLAVQGFQHASTLSAACGFILREGKEATMLRAVTHHEALQISADNPGLAASIAWVKDCPAIRRLMPPGMAAYVHYRTGEIDQEKRDQFFEVLSKGLTDDETSAVYHLRERLLKDRESKARLKQTERLALVNKAWNHYAAGNPVSNLRWRDKGPGTEPFPKLGDVPDPRKEAAGKERHCTICKQPGHNRLTCPNEAAA